MTTNTTQYHGVKAQRRNRQTGTVVSVVDNRDGAISEDDESPWLTVCEDHSELMAFPTRASARYFAAAPAEWCSGCQEVAT